MASERWIQGFTPEGKPIVHFENDGPAFLRNPSQSDTPAEWAELLFNDKLFIEGLDMVIERWKKGDLKPCLYLQWSIRKAGRSTEERT